MPYPRVGPFALRQAPAYDTPAFLNGIEDHLEARSRGATVTVASSTASVKQRRAADYECDGTADEAQINQALADVGSGGKVLLTEGRFFVSSPVLLEKHAITLEGANPGHRVGATHAVGVGTRIEAAAGLTGQALKVQVATNDAPLYGVRLTRFTIDGRSLAGSIDGILFRSYNALIDDITIRECTGNGIKLLGYRTEAGDATDWNLYDTLIRFTQIERADLDALRFDWGATDMHVEHCVLSDSGQDSLHMVNGASSVQTTSTHTYNPGRYNLHLEGTGSRSKFTNMKIEGAGQHGVFFDSTPGTGPSDVQIVGSSFHDNGDSADNTYDHISCVGTAGINRLNIVACNFGWKNQVSNPNKPRYAINAATSGAGDWQVSACKFGATGNFGTGLIGKASSATIHVDIIGVGTPEAVVPASIGSIWRRSDGGSGTVLYIKETGTGSAGWVAATTPRPANFVIASSTASTNWSADYLCDGTDDQVQIQAAHDALPSAGGKILLTEGVFSINAPVLITKDNVTIEGMGTGGKQGDGTSSTATRLELTVNVTGQGILAQNAGNTRPVYALHMRNFTLDGKDLGTNVIGIKAKSDNSSYENVHVWRCTSDGFVFEAYVTNAMNDTKMIGLMSMENAGSGYRLNAQRADDLMFMGCIAGRNDLHGWHIATSSQQLTNCHSYDNLGHGILFDGGGTRTKIVNTKVEGNGLHGIYGDSTNGGNSDIVITGGSGFYNNSAAVANTSSHIALGGASGTGQSGWQITGCIFGWKGTGNKTKYAIDFQNGTERRALVTTNQFGQSSDYGTGIINDAGSTSAGFRAVIKNNMGFTTENSGTAVIASATTSIVVTHECDYTPLSGEITVMPTNNPTNDPGHIWVSSIGATTFTINCRADPGASTLTLGWSVNRGRKV